MARAANNSASRFCSMHTMDLPVDISRISSILEISILFNWNLYFVQWKSQFYSIEINFVQWISQFYSIEISILFNAYNGLSRQHISHFLIPRNLNFFNLGNLNFYSNYSIMCTSHTNINCEHSGLYNYTHNPWVIFVSECEGGTKCLFNPLEIFLKQKLVFYHSFYLAQQNLFLLSGLIHLHNANAINIKHVLVCRNLDLDMVQELFFCESEAISWRSTTSVSPLVSPSPGRPTCEGPSGTSPSSLLPSLESHLRHSSLGRRGVPSPPPPTSTSTPSPPSHPNTPPLSEKIKACRVTFALTQYTKLLAQLESFQPISTVIEKYGFQGKIL